MMNNFMSYGGGCDKDNNSCLWILIILLILCSCGGMIDGIIDKLCSCEMLLPLLLVWLCCNKSGGMNFGGCGK